MTFQDVLQANPYLQQVGFYHLTCKEHGVFRILANGTVPGCCPRCSQPAKVASTKRLLCATSRPVPLVQRWRADNHDVIANTPPAWLRRGEIEDC